MEHQPPSEWNAGPGSLLNTPFHGWNPFAPLSTALLQSCPPPLPSLPNSALTSPFSLASPTPGSPPAPTPARWEPCYTLWPLLFWHVPLAGTVQGMGAFAGLLSAQAPAHGLPTVPKQVKDFLQHVPTCSKEPALLISATTLTHSTHVSAPRAWEACRPPQGSRLLWVSWLGVRSPCPVPASLPESSNPDTDKGLGEQAQHTMASQPQTEDTELS